MKACRYCSFVIDRDEGSVACPNCDAVVDLSPLPELSRASRLVAQKWDLSREVGEQLAYVEVPVGVEYQLAPGFYVTTHMMPTDAEIRRWDRVMSEGLRKPEGCTCNGGDGAKVFADIGDVRTLETDPTCEAHASMLDFVFFRRR